MSARILPFPPRLRPVDDGSVMSAAECLARHHDRIEQGRAAFRAEAAAWEAGRQAAQDEYFRRKRERGDEPPSAA
jgi:hypothetical protein